MLVNILGNKYYKRLSKQRCSIAGLQEGSLFSMLRRRQGVLHGLWHMSIGQLELGKSDLEC